LNEALLATDKQAKLLRINGLRADTIVTWHSADAPQLAKAMERFSARMGRTPRTITVDRGYSEQCVENDLAELAVRMSWSRAKVYPAKPGNRSNEVVGGQRH
jgi:IS5 family transposase